MTMLEKAARALCDRDPDQLVPQSGASVIASIEKNPFSARVTVDLPPIPAWKLFEAKAIALLRAIREPDEVMLDAIRNCNIIYAEDKTLEEYGEIYAAVIDSILAEI